MVAVADDTPGKGRGLKGASMGTLLVHLRLERVAIGTNIFDSIDAGRRRAMVAMASWTGGSTQVSAHDERLMMNAPVIFDELVRRDAISGHVGHVGVAARACIRDVDGVYSGAWIAGRAYVMNAVTICAHCHLAVARGQSLPVNAGVILRELIRAQAGIELPHIGRIGMATAAEIRDFPSFDSPGPTRFLTHGLLCIITARITTMATHAAQALL